MKTRDVARREPRRDRLVKDHAHDPYKARGKLPEPTVCPQCGAVWQDGRWRWSLRPAPAHETLCQACERINDRYPAGEITLAGGFFAAHRDEILNLVRNTEEREKQEHPGHRLMVMNSVEGGMVVTTTDIHLPRRIGDALHDAYKGELNLDYDEDGYFVRVRWQRED